MPQPEALSFFISRAELHSVFPASKQSIRTRPTHEQKMQQYTREFFAAQSQKDPEAVRMAEFTKGRTANTIEMDSRILDTGSHDAVTEPSIEIGQATGTVLPVDHEVNEEILKRQTNYNELETASGRVVFDASAIPDPELNGIEISYIDALNQASQSILSEPLIQATKKIVTLFSSIIRTS